MKECNDAGRKEAMLNFIWEKRGSPLGFTPIRQVNRIRTEDGDIEEVALHGEFKEPIEIGLAHVLEAIQEIDTDYVVAYGDGGIFYEIYKGIIITDDTKICDWILFRAPFIPAVLRDQPPETIEAIAKLLGWVDA